MADVQEDLGCSTVHGTDCETSCQAKCELPGEPEAKDFTEVSSFIVCPRKWYARHWLNLVPLEASSAPQFGIGIHAAFDTLYKSNWDLDAALEVWKGHTLISDANRTRGVGELLIRGYYKEYLSQPLVALHNEVRWLLPIKHKGLEFSLCGRIDRVVKQFDKVWIMDHKTTSRLGAFYFEQFNPNLQVVFYTKAGKEYFGDIAGMIIDAVFVGKTQRFQRDVVTMNPKELEMRYAEGLEWIYRMLMVEQELAEKPDEWRTICPRAMVTECCSAWSGCEYKDLCRWDFAQAIIDAEFRVEEWKP